MRKISNVILMRGNTLLLGWRGANRSYPSCWALPGGHLEAGESPEAAALREMREELGIAVKGLRYLTALETTDSRGTVTFHILLSVAWEGGEPQIRDAEHAALRWFDIEDACDLRPLALEGYRQCFRLAAAAR